MNDLSFARPWFLLALAVVPIVYGAWAWGMARGTRRVRSISRAGAGGPRYAAVALLALAAASAIVALAQPRWGTRTSVIPREGAQLVVVLDVSRSMGSKDVPPTRLDAAKAAINATLNRMGGDRVGLVIFAGDARLRFPLTTDFTAASQVISQLETGSLIVDAGTSASAGLDVAISAFDPGSEAGKLILLITDGDDLGDDPVAVAQRVNASGIELLVAGAGTANGGTVPIYDAATRQLIDKKDAAGNVLVSKLNEPFLRSLAIAAGGRYIGSDLRSVPGAVEGRLATLKRARIERQSASLPVERYQWFAGAALALLVLGWLAERLPRRAARQAFGMTGALLVMLLLAACSARAYDLNEDGLKAYRSGDFERAVELFLEARAERPDNSQVTLNLAAALHSAGRYEEATTTARRLLQSPDAVTRGRAEASIGHHRFALQDLPGALEAFRQALIENPNDGASRHDYEVVLRLLNPQPPGDSQVQQPPESPQPNDAGATPPPGQPTPDTQPGGSPDPNATTTTAPGAEGAQPQPGQPGSQPGNGQNAPDNNRPASPAEVDRQLRDLDTQIARLVQEAGDNPTASQALAILQMLAERSRLAAIRDALTGGGDPRDY
ncbi:MAG: VWA domain-containing protein [Chloroflexi bacterium]|nr:VWA domain-containing protein [Chloroflexota bacterium]